MLRQIYSIRGGCQDFDRPTDVDLSLQHVATYGMPVVDTLDEVLHRISPPLMHPPKPLVLLDAVFSSGSCRLRNRCAAAVFLVQGSCKVRGWHRVLFKAFGRSHRPGPDTFGVGPDLDPNQTLRAGSGPDSDSYRAGYMSDL